MKRRIESFRKGIYIHLEELNLREGEGFGEHKGKGKEGRKKKKKNHFNLLISDL